MSVIMVLQFIAIIFFISYTVWVAYFVTHQEERKKRLKRYKKERGDEAYRLYKKILTREYLEASSLFCVGLVLIFVSGILHPVHELTELVFVLWILSMICTFVSGTMIFKILKS